MVYLHQRNKQMLKIRALVSLENLLINSYQYITAIDVIQSLEYNLNVKKWEARTHTHTTPFCGYFANYGQERYKESAMCIKMLSTTSQKLCANGIKWHFIRTFIVSHKDKSFCSGRSGKECVLLLIRKQQERTLSG